MSRNHVALVGGSANNGTNAGTFYVNANNASSNRNRNIGTQLAAKKKLDSTPARVGEYVSPTVLGSASEQHGRHQQ